MNLNEKLAELRKAKGLTQQELAEALNVSRQAVSRWEVGTAAPSLDNLVLMSRLYGVPLDDFIQEETGAEALKTVPMEAAAAVPARTDRRYIAPVCLFLAILILGVGILIGTSLRQKSEKTVYVYTFDPGEPITVNGWTAQLEEPSPLPEHDIVKRLSPYKVIAKYDPALGLLEMLPDNIPETVKKDFERRVSKMNDLFVSRNNPAYSFDYEKRN